IGLLGKSAQLVTAVGVGAIGGGAIVHAGTFAAGADDDAGGGAAIGVSHAAGDLLDGQKIDREVFVFVVGGNEEGVVEGVAVFGHVHDGPTASGFGGKPVDD